MRLSSVIASLAQVHRAILRETGQEYAPPPPPSSVTTMTIGTNEFRRVAVKLQHPALAEWIPLDMSLTKFSFEYIKWFFPEYPMTWLSDEMEASYVYP